MSEGIESAERYYNEVIILRKGKVNETIERISGINYIDSLNRCIYP